MRTLPEFAAPVIPPTTPPPAPRSSSPTVEGHREPATLVDLVTLEEAMREDPHLRQGLLLGGAYRLQSPIGAGTTGAVYAARHEPSGAMVAVKVLRDRWRGSTGQRHRFDRETRAGSTIRHHHIVRLLDAGAEPDGTAWQVLELLRGRELATAIEERRLSVEETLILARQLLEALDAVHFRAYVHRDVKPENVFLVDRPDGRLFAKLLDFGIVKPLLPTQSMRSITGEGVLIGTPDYMAPEQISGDLPVSPASDLWALGAVLFTALTGRPPFEADQLSALLVRIARDPAPTVRYFRPEVPRSLEAVLAKALQTHPAHRYRDALAMSDAIEACIDQLGGLDEL